MTGEFGAESTAERESVMVDSQERCDDAEPPRGAEAVVLVVRTEEEEGGLANVDEDSIGTVGVVMGERRRVEELAEVESCETGGPSTSYEPNQLCRRGMDDRCALERFVGSAEMGGV